MSAAATLPADDRQAVGSAPDHAYRIAEAGAVRTSDIQWRGAMSLSVGRQPRGFVTRRR
jgi:hypothetical protein